MRLSSYSDDNYYNYDNLVANNCLNCQNCRPF